MPATVVDADGRPFAVQLDAAEAGLVVTIIRALQARSQRGWLPVPVEALLVACEQVAAAGQDVSTDGHIHDHAAADDPVLTPKQIASQYEVDRRTAQRWCRRFGFEDDGRLFARQSALELR